MASRSIASLTISFGLVSIPVRLHTATQASGGVHFNLLHATCGSRLRQQYVCIKEDVVVSRDEMAKGYEFTKDQYVMFSPEELEELEEKGTQTVEITEFLPGTAIDPVYYDKAYYLVPDKGGAKPYSLLAESMRRSGRSALGRYAARGKQYLVQLRVVADGLVMQQLMYADEVRAIADLEIPATPVKGAELDLAMKLIDQIASDQFHPERYHDEVKARIEEAVARKVEGQEIAISPEAPGGGGEVIDLMAALRASLGGAKPRATAAATPEPGAARPARRSASAKPAAVLDAEPARAVRKAARRAAPAQAAAPARRRARG